MLAESDTGEKVAPKVRWVLVGTCHAQRSGKGKHGLDCEGGRGADRQAGRNARLEGVGDVDRQLVGW